ncbi:hypothetical protein C1H76_8866 [Elsinoe australis]|uniref:Uncharacterized protein n=1 Tax=Elsinoe australis TaxID=40998 RepID=A0A4U7AVA2_9PEZI|nr:hypothetical protein C1H76_8866 [Elsinoe australis]
MNAIDPTFPSSPSRHPTTSLYSPPHDLMPFPAIPQRKPALSLSRLSLSLTRSNNLLAGPSRRGPSRRAAWSKKNSSGVKLSSEFSHGASGEAAGPVPL